MFVCRLYDDAMFGLRSAENMRRVVDYPNAGVAPERACPESLLTFCEL
jgi:hypothetical protein